MVLFHTSQYKAQKPPSRVRESPLSQFWDRHRFRDCPPGNCVLFQGGILGTDTEFGVAKPLYFDSHRSEIGVCPQKTLKSWTRLSIRGFTRKSSAVGRGGGEVDAGSSPRRH